MTLPSSFSKKRSMRMSTATRQSLANMLNQRSFSSKSSSRNSRIMVGFSDSRCYKHSPRVGQHHTYVGQELADFEAEQWRAAFAAMGGLRERGTKAPKLFTVLNKAPYHCSSLGRQFEVRYGELIKLQRPVFRKSKKADRPQICNCITKEALPLSQEKKVTGPLQLHSSMSSSYRLPRTTYYLPKSCVYVRWDPRVYNSVDKICEWLISCFGPFIFTTRSANNSMLVAFETMEQALRAVKFPLQSSSKISIHWWDPSFYNFSNYKKFANYSILTDPIWKRSIEEKAKLRTVQRTPQNDTKIKCLRINEI
ncbi:hypothetical protein RRG08_017950 [Elysia crispata]|uniref:Uncharacterized protein n=1 Tax=Elysia crispata TaxID=231223 RepID=A0AAE0ZD39_9GAST|nr:hypothetical protein RRG08_017950 [Elysia crispata]